MSFGPLVWKRLFDIVAASVALVISLPVLAISSLLIRMDSHGPILFCQVRYGRKGELFKLCKLRTMIDAPRIPAKVLLCDPEVTRVGRVLRRLKIDELPQLWSVLRGDMSIVGPRPAMPEQLDTLDDIGKNRLKVRPGLTGLAQVYGNTHLSWEERWKYDAQYVERLSFALDGWILYRTVLVILVGEERWKELPNDSQ
jgi:lipopolysaccharide/colanic/teichoic acid biosynthesis glycosyltransferase